ncbi:MAG TPA: pilus assembly protein N-terminal domain-containing protein, partial [Gemmataceae bacterium]|nr:pilus assembly protein N-terminal domain-containing protein [Gemmataceae bacterium]
MESPLPGFANQSRRSMWVAAVVGCVACAYAAAQPHAPTVVPPTVIPAPAPAALPPAAETHRNAACPPAGSTFPAPLPPAPVRPARPATGSGAVNEFVDGVGHNDASFEVLVGQGRILTTKVDLSVRGKPSALVAVGDPTVVDFVIVNARQIRVIGQRIGVSDLSITTPDGQTYGFEVRVVADLHVLQRQLNCLFPDASVKLTQVRDHVAVEGQARDTVQVNRILETVRAYLESVQTGQARRISGQREGPREVGPGPGKGDAPPAPKGPEDPMRPAEAGPERAGLGEVQATVAAPRVINLLRVPGSQQVLLKVRVAELNRTVFRQIGADFLIRPDGATIGSQIGGSTVSAGAALGVPATGTTTAGAAAAGSLAGFAEILLGASNTAFAIFDQGDFAFFFSVLRRNSVLRVLAEPNLVALNGHAATFLAGGEFPIPVPQGGGGAGVGTGAITIQFREFGVRLAFLPTILDGDVIRLSVDPEVSSIDFTLGTVLVPGGTPVPGLNTRKAHTVVELR